MVGRVWFFLFLALFFLFSKAKPTNPQPQELKSFKIRNTQRVRGCSYVVSIKTSCSSRSFTRDMVSLAFGDAYGNQRGVPFLRGLVAINADDKVRRRVLNCVVLLGLTNKLFCNGDDGHNDHHRYLYNMGRMAVMALVMAVMVYVPRLDDPDSRTFERCSTDTYTLSGTCMYKICYLYLLRRGSDGWKPESVKVYPPNSKAITFEYNMFLPNGVWYGFNSCNGVSSHINGTGNLISQI